MLESLEKELHFTKLQLEAKLEQLEEDEKTRKNQDGMQVDNKDGADLQTEIKTTREEIQKMNGQLEAVTKEFIRELQDPQHFFQLAQLQFSNEEYDLVILVSKAGHELILKLDAE